ncbi:TIM-barrel domain-containing protein [Natrialbaceae archaeon A-CW3]
MVRASLSEVDRYKCDGRSITLDCTVAVDHTANDKTYELKDRSATVSLEFYNPETVRFTLAANESDSDSDLAHVGCYEPKTITEDVDLSVTETDGTLTVSTDALLVKIGLDQWKFEIAERNGTSLLTEQHTDRTAKQESRTNPLGFSLEEINRWPYRTAETGGSFVLHADEHIYGFGEKFTEFDKRGQRINSWITQPNGTETEDAYKNVPFYLSTRGYGFLVDTVKRTTFDIGQTSTVSKSIHVEDNSFSFVFFNGSSFKDILETYTGLTGRPGDVPKWSLGIWMSRLGYQSREELERVTTEIREREFPCDVINLDPPWLRPGHLCDLTWDEEAFENPAEMVDSLHDEGFKLCLWEYPYLLTETDAFDEARENGYLVNDPRGDPYLLTRISWASDQGGIIDFTNDEAVEWWKQKHTPLIEMGVDAFKTDFGEYLPRDAILSDGRGGEAVRNEFSLRYTGTVHEAMVDAGVEPLLWARPGWTGGQRYPVHWGGDPHATFESMAASLRGGLSLSLSGYGFWSCDIGGFHGDPSPELYVRWAQFALLGLSHARFHGTTPREPWEFGEEVTDIVTRYAQERYQLLPYLHCLAKEATERGIPVLRPLILEFQDDRAVYDIQTQLMLGEALLVAPVVSPTDTRQVYLPPGEWVDYWNGERYDGGQTITVETPLETMPVFQRAGTAIPMQESTQWIDETPADSVTVQTVLGTETRTAATTTLYENHPDGVDLSILTDKDTKRIDIDLEDDSERIIIEILAVETVPEAVEVNGSPVDRVDTDPDHGQWCYSAETDTIIVLN